MDKGTSSTGLARLFATLLSALALWGVRLQAQPTITVQPVTQTVGLGSNATFTVSVMATGPVAYHWQFNGTEIPATMISTVAGGGTGGDGGAATNAKLLSPKGLAVTSSGELLIADSGNNRIRKVDTNGIITTVAGGGTGGDGGLATNAALFGPTGVALDAAGNLWIADTANQRVRKVDTQGVITTVAGTGTPGYSGDGGAATNAALSAPFAVAVDGLGNVYIADQANHRIRKVDTHGVITTIVGTGATGSSGDGGPATNAPLTTPSGLALDNSGNLFIADSPNNRIRKVDTNGVITRVAGPGLGPLGDGGPATNANLYYPVGVNVDAAGNLYITDSLNQRVRLVDRQGMITTLAGHGTPSGGFAGDGGPATNATLNQPNGVVLDSAGNMYFADSANQRVRKVAFGGFPTLTVTNAGPQNAGRYDVVVRDVSGASTSGVVRLDLLGPPLVLLPPAGQMAWAGSNASFTVDATGSPPLSYQWYRNGTLPVDAGTNALLQLEALNTQQAGSYSVVVTNSYGSVTSSAATLIVNQLLSGPLSQTVLAGDLVTLGVEVLGGGPLQFQWQFNGTNLPNNIIRTVAGQAHTGFAGDGGPATNALLNIFGDLAFDRAGNLYIPDWGNSRIRKLDPTGLITTVAGNGVRGSGGDGGPATNASLSGASGVAIDAAGNLFIADGGNNRVRKVGLNGAITTSAGTGSPSFSGDGGQATNATLSGASGVCFDAAGNLYISDYANERVRRVTPAGIISTVAGNGSMLVSGDGGLATQAGLANTFGPMVDAAGNLYFAGGHRIRLVTPFGFISTLAGNGSSTFGGDGGPATSASLSSPLAEVLDAQGNLFIADYNHYRVRKVDTQGIITTVVGNGLPGTTGDGGPSTNATIRAPSGVAFDQAGNLFIAAQSAVREICYGGLPNLTLSNLSLSAAGGYRVIITSPGGSITSSVANLTVQLRPRITSLAPQVDGSVTLGFSGTPNSTNRVWVTTDLTPPVAWVAFSTNVAGGDGTWQCMDTNAAAGSSPRFYRASMP